MTIRFRTRLLRSFGLAVMLAAPALAHAAATFGFDDVVAKAKALAAKPFQQPKPIPDFLANISYNDYRDIRFRVEDSLWKQSNTRFQVRLIHPGLYYKHSVTINVVDAQGVHEVQFSPQLFDYGHNKFADKIPPDLGFAGFKLTYPLKDKKADNQFIVFAGASYFRAVGRDEAWGLSARGLAVDTGLQSGEEFPFFKEFWLVRPAPDAQQMTVYALLDSKRVTGAYQFVIKPGETTVVDVKTTLFERADIKQLGIAPLTSMFFYGEDSPKPAGYWRPEVHDSDGLLVHAGTGEWLWRPLINPAQLLLSAFQLKNPLGFGLMQRDRHFYDYQDLEARYDIRPSAWVMPDGDWGDGQVMLVEIPSDKEVNDNIVAFWVPKNVPKLGEPLNFSYTIRWTSHTPQPAAIGQNTSTWIGAGDKPPLKRFVLEFNSAVLSSLPADAKVEGVITVGDGGKLVEQHTEKNPVTGGWRLSFEVDPPDKPLELRAFLKAGDKTLTETWSFLYAPPS
ncbi:MAG TPA: glucan biosynthesis protein G [Gammaproteobacteria bacterium]|nr:glucan biosynthesis protein G [Gammaproteobacteria bacterium]